MAQFLFSDFGAQLIGPLPLRSLDVADHTPTGRSEIHKLCPAVTRVVLVFGQAVFDEQVRHSLNALAGKAKNSSDLRHRGRSIFYRCEDFPPRARLPRRLCQCVTGGYEAPVQAKNVHDQLGEGIALWRT